MKKNQRMGKNICKSYLIRELHPDYIKNSYKSIIKRTVSQLKKTGEGSKRTFLQRRNINGQQTNGKMLNTLLAIREMQIKNTVNYSLISIRIAIIKKMDLNECPSRMWRNHKLHTLLVRL